MASWVHYYTCNSTKGIILNFPLIRCGSGKTHKLQIDAGTKEKQAREGFISGQVTN